MELMLRIEDGIDRLFKDYDELRREWRFKLSQLQSGNLESLHDHIAKFENDQRMMKQRFKIGYRAYPLPKRQLLTVAFAVALVLVILYAVYVTGRKCGGK